eukprot:bmy_10195T0
MEKGQSYRRKNRTCLGSQKTVPSTDVISPYQQIAFRPPSCKGVKFKTFLGLFIRTEKEKPSRNGRRPQHLISLMFRTRILSGGTAEQGRLPHHCSKTIHLHLKDARSWEPVASLGF